MNAFWKLVDILNKTGWHYLYMIESRQGRKDKTTTYYLVPYYPEHVSKDELIDILSETFGVYSTYIYECKDVHNIWNIPYGETMIEITLPNK